MELIGNALTLSDLVAYADGAVVSKTLIDKKVGTVTIFSFGAGQGLSEHTAPFDAVVEVVDGEAEVIINGEPQTVSAGQMIIMPANIPPGREDDYRMAAERVADGVSGALPNGSDIKFPTAGVRGEAPFKNYCDAQENDVVLAGTGGRLAMLTADKGGLGSGPSREHATAFDEIAEADARKISAVLQRDFDRLELAMEFPGQPALAYFELSAQDAIEVTQVVNDAATLTSAGHTVDAAWLSAATGFKFVDTKSTPEAAQ